MQELWRCEKLSCNRHFSPLQGYIDYFGPNKRVNDETRNIRFCKDEPDHEGSVAIVEIRDCELVWRCIHEDCTPKPILHVKSLTARPAV